MIASLKGKIKNISGQNILIDVKDVGYEVFCTAACLSELNLNREGELIVYTDVQETSIKLYGFKDFLEKQVFLLLISVSGIGAKTAVDIISKIDKVELLKVIGTEDSEHLKKIKGIGNKTADRLIVELKDKVKEVIESNRMVLEISGTRTETQAFDEALQALLALGFTQKDAKAALSRISNDMKSIKDTGEVVKRALGVM